MRHRPNATITIKNADLPMTSDPKTLIIPVLMIAIGTGWLLTAQGIVPDVDWIWTLGLFAIGALSFVVSGFDKFSIVVGPLFLGASLLSVLRQTNRISVDTEVPLLVILGGITLLFARQSDVPSPTWMIQSTSERKQAGRSDDVVTQSVAGEAERR